MSTNPADPKSPFFKQLYPALIEKPVERRKVRDFEEKMYEIDIEIERLKKRLAKVNSQREELRRAKQALMQ